MRIALDAMGGDHAPEEIIAGALQAEPLNAAELVLVGDQEKLKNILGRLEGGQHLKVLHAPETVGMEETGAKAIRTKRETSLSVSMRLLAENRVDAMVSAGNSAAIVANARHLLGLIPGVRRPALAVPLPTPNGNALLLDVGAHAEASTVNLVQSAALAHVYLKVQTGMDQPRLGLINIGHEPVKGPKFVRRAFALLKRSRLHFIGNIEPHDLFSERVDALICDGFVGNVLLKLYEGLFGGFSDFVQTRFLDYQQERGGGQNTAAGYRTILQCQNTGGAPLLGVRKTVVVAHGRSRATAITDAINLACSLVNNKIYEMMAEELRNDSILHELKHLSSLMLLEKLKPRWGFA
jgi:phosphate acyltransferase